MFTKVELAGEVYFDEVKCSKHSCYQQSAMQTTHRSDDDDDVEDSPGSKNWKYLKVLVEVYFYVEVVVITPLYLAREVAGVD